MHVYSVSEKEWIKGDYRPAFCFSLDMEYFEEYFKEKALEYYEDGLGPAKAIMCKCDGIQYYIRWLQLSENQYKTDVYLLYPFLNGTKEFEIFISNLKIDQTNVTWKHEDI